MTNHDKNILIGILILFGGFGIIAYICGGKGFFIEGPVFIGLIIAFIALLVWLINRKSSNPSVNHNITNSIAEDGVISKEIIIEGIYDMAVVNKAIKTPRKLVGGKFGNIRADYNEKMLADIDMNDPEYYDGFAKKILASIFGDYFNIINMWYKSIGKAEQTFDATVLSEDNYSISLYFTKCLIISSQMIGTVSIEIRYLRRETMLDLSLTTNDGTVFRTNTQMNKFPINYPTDIKNHEASYLRSLDDIISRNEFKKYLQTIGLSINW